MQVRAKLSGKKDPVPVSSEKFPALEIYLREDTGGAIQWQVFSPGKISQVDDRGLTFYPRVPFFVYQI
jgi:hypothetical protein